MKLNKSIIYSILTIVTLIYIASTGTLAFFQDTKIPGTLACIQDKNSIWLVVDRQPAYPNGLPGATVPGVELTNVIPTPKGSNGLAPDKKMKTFSILNRGLVKGGLYVQFVPVIQTLGKGSNIIIKLGNVELFNNGINKASNPVYLRDISPYTWNGYDIYKPDLMYNFADTGKNQNKFENKKLRFNLVFTMKAAK